MKKEVQGHLELQVPLAFLDPEEAKEMRFTVEDLLEKRKKIES